MGVATVTEGATPRVLDSFGASVVTLNFSSPLGIFGFEAEPNLIDGPYSITAQFFDGATLVGTISQNLNGYQGARLFAAETTTEVFTSIRITAAAGADGFAIARPRYAAPVPEPATLTLLTSGIAALMGYRKRRRSS